MTFKIGDEVVGISSTYYYHTKKGNGYGIVTSINNRYMLIKWYNPENEFFKPTYYVEQQYFELKEKKFTTWKARYKNDQ